MRTGVNPPFLQFLSCRRVCSQEWGCSCTGFGRACEQHKVPNGSPPGHQSCCCVSWVPTSHGPRTGFSGSGSLETWRAIPRPRRHQRLRHFSSKEFEVGTRILQSADARSFLDSAFAANRTNYGSATPITLSALGSGHPIDGLRRCQFNVTDAPRHGRERCGDGVQGLIRTRRDEREPRYPAHLLG